MGASAAPGPVVPIEMSATVARPVCGADFGSPATPFGLPAKGSVNDVPAIPAVCSAFSGGAPGPSPAMPLTVGPADLNRITATAPASETPARRPSLRRQGC